MPTLGERIYTLRKSNNLSQGDLAEKLDVSRQTISKWENNSSVPELEKIILLSSVFSVTTDYIIKGEAQLEAEIITPSYESEAKKPKGKTIAGIALLVTGCVIFTICCFTLEVLAMLGAMIAAIGVVLLVCKKHTLLVVFWLSFIMLERFCRYFTTVNMKLVFQNFAYQDFYLYQLICSYILWLILLVLILCTISTLAKNRK